MKRAFAAVAGAQRTNTAHTAKAVLLALLLAVSATAGAQGGGAAEANVRFVLTTERYQADEDLAAAVQAEFGAAAEVADWREIEERFGRSQATITAFLRRIGLDVDGHAWVVVDGSRIFPGPGLRGEPERTRYYLISRWDRNIPGTYEVHEQIADGILVLGSWYDLALPVLAKVP